MPSLHAVRNASGAKRWRRCPGSIRMSRGRPSTSSDAARLGTAAHALGEACLLRMCDAHDFLGGVVLLDDNDEALVVHPGPDAGEAYEAENFPVDARYEVDAEMVDAVQVYLDAVRAEVERLGPHAELHVERRFDLNWLVGFDWHDAVRGEDGVMRSPSGLWMDESGPEPVLRNADGTESLGPMFGTNDASVFLPFDHLTVFDYKNGSGVLVEVYDVEEVSDGSGGVMTVENGNDQELYYALGAAEEVGWAFETLDLVIVQPRARHEDGAVRRWSTTKAYLMQFRDQLREDAKRAEDPNAPLCAGDWCGFCPAAGIPCPELEREAYRQARVEFSEAGDAYLAAEPDAGTSDDALARAMAAKPVLNAFIKAVEAEAMRRLREAPGGVLPFGKLVRKKSNRKFVDKVERTDPATGEPVEVPVVEALAEAGFPRAMLFHPPKMLSPSQVEKLRPKDVMQALKEQGVKAPVAYLKAKVAELSHKPPGGVTIAPLSDPREPVDPSAAAESDFDAVDNEENSDE